MRDMILLDRVHYSTHKMHTRPFRQFYAEKSKDYRSDRYRRHAAMKKRRSDTENDLERFDKLRDEEIEKLTKDAAETLVLSRKSFEEKQRRSQVSILSQRAIVKLTPLQEAFVPAPQALRTLSDSMRLTTEG